MNIDRQDGPWAIGVKEKAHAKTRRREERTKAFDPLPNAKLSVAEVRVQIANPIYDVVFKYLMDDEKVAKLLLSALLGLDIEALEYCATERPNSPLAYLDHKVTCQRYPAASIF